MFYPVDSLRRGGRFYLCWVADSWPLRFATITHKQLWSQDIRQICEDLLEVVRNESGRPANRFSLRLSAQLLRGLVRLYQRKVTVLVGEMCMINARVMKVTNKRLAIETDYESIQKRPRLPVMIIEEQADEERVIERIENSGNVVANVEDITLKEPTIPQNQTLLDDGFGELQLRSMELMRGEVREEQVSGVSAALHESARSRLELSARPAMEGVSDLDISVFRKSMGESLLAPADFDKEIPDMPEIHPVCPAPQIDNEAPEIQRVDIHPGEALVGDSTEKRRIEDEEFVLDELQEQQPKRRRKNVKGKIVDGHIKLTSQFMASRIENVFVELRCENGRDKISTLVPESILMNRPAHAGFKARSNIGYTHTRLFVRNLEVSVKRNSEDREMERILTARPRRSSIRAAHKHSVEEPTVETHLQGVQQEGVADISHVPIDVDLSLLPTQIIVTSPPKRTSELDRSSKRIRHSGFMSFAMCQQLQEIAQDSNKENVPENYQHPADVSKNDMPIQQNVDELTQMLQAEGLADVERPRESERPNIGERSETPLGSLDRTKVSLGDSEKTTDSKRFIREEWGTQGTMHKIYACVRAGGPVRVDTLVARGPALAGHTRLIAARCFTSILKLKQHGFINVLKDTETYEIIDIQLGNKITLRK